MSARRIAHQSSSVPGLLPHRVVSFALRDDVLFDQGCEDCGFAWPDEELTLAIRDPQQLCSPKLIQNSAGITPIPMQLLG